MIKGGIFRSRPFDLLPTRSVKIGRPISNRAAPKPNVGGVCCHDDACDRREVDAVLLVRKHSHGFDIEAHDDRNDREDDPTDDDGDRRIEHLLGVSLSRFRHSALLRHV